MKRLLLIAALTLPVAAQNTGDWSADYTEDATPPPAAVFTYQADPGGGNTQYWASWSDLVADVLASPTLVTPDLGTPSAGVLSSCTAYPSTALTTTGEAGGSKFLREDGDGTVSWQTIPAGSFDSTTVDATTWSDGANASNIWTFDVSGTDHTMTAGDGIMTFSGDVTAVGDMTVTDLNAATMIFAGGTSGTITLAVPAVAGTNTLTLPAATGTLSTVTGTETLENKTIDFADNVVVFPVSIGVAASDETTDLTVADNKVTFRAPYAFTLTEVRANVNTAPTGSGITVDVTEGGATVFSTLLTIDATEETSTTAATAAVISDSAIADDAEISINVDVIGSTTAGKGLKLWFIGTRSL